MSPLTLAEILAQLPDPRKGSAPQVLAALRNAVVHVLAGVEAVSRAAAVEQLAARSHEARGLLGLPSLQ